jgi:uncharacterized protein YrrD
MQFKSGAGVITVDGKRVGRIKRVIMTPRSQEVTGLVVERGFLFTVDRVLPLNWVAHTADNGDVILYEDKADFDGLPEYEEKLYIPRDEAEPGDQIDFAEAVYYYGSPRYGVGYAYPPEAALAPRYVTRTVENIPDGTVALDIGSDVISTDDQNVGHVEEVITSDSGAATHFLVAKGLFFQARKLIPTDWIARVEEKRVLLSVPARLLNRLPDYDNHDWEVPLTM